MTTQLFDEELGAQKHILFGCTVRSVNVELGLDNKASSLTVVVVKEEDQEFIFQQDVTPSKGTKSLSVINIGAFSFLGVVESWQETLTSPQGSGIFEIKLTDGRAILRDSNLIVSSRIPDRNPSGPFDIDDFSTDPSLGQFVQVPLERVKNFSNAGFRLDPILVAIEQAQIQFGGSDYTIDLSEVQDIINSRSSNPDDIDGSYKLPNMDTSISQLVSKIAKDLNFYWFIDIIQDSVTNIHVLKIRVIDRALDVVPENFDMDALAVLHADRVMSRKQGFETTSNDDVVLLLSGGVRQTLVEHSGNTMKPFWGWTLDSGKFTGDLPSQLLDSEPPLPARTAFAIDNSNLRQPFVPLDSPGFHMPGTSSTELFSTSIEQMKLAIANELEDQLTDRDLTNLKNYAKNHWGRKFYIPIPSGDWDITPTNTWVNAIDAGWWERDGTPGDIDIAVNREFFNKLITKDGRWVSFMKLPDLTSLEQSGMPLEWHGSMTKTNSVIYNDTELFMKVNITRVEHFWIIQTATPLVIQTSGGDFNRITDMNSAVLWSPESDFRLFYGPWSSDDGIPLDQRQQGSMRVQTAKYLVPWIEGFPGITNAEGMTVLNKLARSKVSNFKPMKNHVNTGQLEVADLPAVNIGTRLGDGGIINKLSISFTITGIRTRYTMGLIDTITKEGAGIENRLDKLEKMMAEKFRTEINEVNDPTLLPPDIDRIIPIPPDDDDDELTPEFPVDEEFFNVVIGKPEGGKGEIVGKTPGRPFYIINRLNARQLTDGFGSQIDLALVPTWNSVRNLAEKDNSPGLLPIGQIVTVSIYEDEIGGAEPFIEVTPPNFAPPQP